MLSRKRRAVDLAKLGRIDRWGFFETPLVANRGSQFEFCSHFDTHETMTRDQPKEARRLI
jgi:hypothetical protein